MQALIVFIVLVLCPLAVLYGIAQIKKTKSKDGAGERGGEMRASELRRMIAAAVEAATGPLAARITDLEERLGDEPVHAIRERLVENRLDAPALSAAFDPEADLDDADGLPLQRRARA